MDDGLFARCGHPRTPDNIKPSYNRPGGRCRTCYNATERKLWAKNHQPKGPTRIEVEWLEDSHDCETCGYSCASGARVRIDGEVRVEMIPRAHCFNDAHFPEDEVYRAIIVALGYDLVDPHSAPVPA